MLHQLGFACVLLLAVACSMTAEEDSGTSPVLHALIEKSSIIVLARLEEGQGVAQGSGELITDKYSVITAIKGKVESGKALEVQRLLPLGTGEKLQTNVRPYRVGDTFIIFIGSITATGSATVTDLWLGIQPHDRALESVIKKRAQ